VHYLGKSLGTPFIQSAPFRWSTITKNCLFYKDYVTLQANLSI